MIPKILNMKLKRMLVGFLLFVFICKSLWYVMRHFQPFCVLYRENYFAELIYFSVNPKKTAKISPHKVDNNAIKFTVKNSIANSLSFKHIWINLIWYFEIWSIQFISLQILEIYLINLILSHYLHLDVSLISDDDVNEVLT